MTHEAHGAGAGESESGIVPSIAPTTVSDVPPAPTPTPRVWSSWPNDASARAVPSPGHVTVAPPPREDRATWIMIGVGVAMLVVLSIAGLQIGRRDRAANAVRAAATSRPVAAAAAPPPPAVSALPEPATAPVSIELDDSETIPLVPADKLPDVAPGPATADTAMHGTTAVPPNPY